MNSHGKVDQSNPKRPWNDERIILWTHIKIPPRISGRWCNQCKGSAKTSAKDLYVTHCRFHLCVMCRSGKTQERQESKWVVARALSMLQWWVIAYRTDLLSWEIMKILGWYEQLVMCYEYTNTTQYLNLIPRIHIKQPTTTCISSSGELDTFWPSQASLPTCTTLHTDTQIYNFNTKNLKFWKL